MDQFSLAKKRRTASFRSAFISQEKRNKMCLTFWSIYLCMNVCGMHDMSFGARFRDRSEIGTFRKKYERISFVSDRVLQFQTREHFHLYCLPFGYNL